MKETESDVYKNNIHNKENKLYQHNRLESTIIPLNKEIEQNEIQEEKENDTINTKIEFLKINREEKNNPIYNLYNSSPNIRNNAKEEKNTKKSFYQRAKKWAGTVWGYMNITNYFPKTEYIEYRNVNGDMVKIPKKKLPLKKKKQKVNKDDEHKTVEKDNGKAKMYIGNNMPLGSHFI